MNRLCNVVCSVPVLGFVVMYADFIGSVIAVCRGFIAKMEISVTTLSGYYVVFMLLFLTNNSSVFVYLIASTYSCKYFDSFDKRRVFISLSS